ncbi:TetR/AcrR family transcriptional regulator [Streptomyces sp. NBC_00120]|uniref:TetR/AcrR family transcriptional regulator n=1 Tax=Streptomyces sp. NBC_00120 TaxID=2975660 RepID=UPI002259F8A1|nr:TetR/AcrR family transcriptional regulator [Streptomyces sp. NBC_00120]MCX5322070.1 TetR/AcrR family transcriptional regulator [Streptomyces sp. NBC_00120]
MSAAVITRLAGMVRWEPGTRERLQAAAIDLYIGRGYDRTTAADIAQAVGLTERTFFRHFADKREVLFSGQELLEQAFLDGVAAAGADASPLEMVESALSAAAPFFSTERRDHSRRRQRIISENPALQERELLNLAGLATALASALRSQGVPEATATLAAESGVTVFGVAFGKWISESEERSFLDIEREVLGELVAMAASAT